MSGPTNYDSQGLEMFTEHRPAIVQLADLLDYIHEMRDLYNETQQALQEAQSYHYFVSVKEFGAMGDGVTDDTQAFIDAIVSLGNVGCLYIPKGVYNISSTLVTDKRISFVGDGKDVSVMKFTGREDGLKIFTQNDPGISKISIQDLSLIGNNDSRDGLHFGYLTDSLIHNVTISNFGRDGIHMEKGWIVDFSNTTIRENKRHGLYVASINVAYSEVNAITIRKMNSIRNEKIGIVVGDETLTFSENTGFGITIKDSHFSENGIGNIQLSGARSVNINDGNYFEVVGTKISTYGGDPFHIYVGKRSGSGVGMCQEVTIEGNHFNAMNDTRYGANNTTGYAITLDNVIGVNIGKNHFYQSIQGSVLAKTSSRRIKIEPNSVYESNGIPFLTDQTNDEVVYWEQNKNTLSLKGEFAGKTFANQGFENIVRNGEFLMTNSSNVPVAFTSQSFTFTKETDGALVATADGGGFAKLLYTMSSNRLPDFKGKYITLTIRCKVPTGNTQNYFVFTNDGVTEVTQSIAKNDTYADVTVTRKLSDSATKLEVGILNYNSSTVTTDKVYIKNITAVKGRSATPYQKNYSDHHFENLTHHAELSLPNLKTANDNASALAVGVPSFGLYKDSSGNLKIRTT